MTTPLQPQITNIGLPQDQLQQVASQWTPTYPASPIQPDQRYYTEAELNAERERVRQQEKDKMYERIEKTNTQLNEFKATVESLKADKDTRDAELAAQQKAAKDEAKRLETEKLSALELIEKQRVEFESQQQQLREDMELRLTIAAKEQERLQLKSYIQRRVNEEINATTVLPELVEYIDGTTEAEVEASIQKAKDNTASIVNAALGTAAPSLPMGTSPTGTPFSPLDNLSPSNRQLSRDQIANMNMKDYEAFRIQQGIDRAGSGRGILS